MTQSANASKPAEDSGEIDRIIQEIEEMEKSIDEVQPQAAESAKVVPIREPQSEVYAGASADDSRTAETGTAKDPIGFDRALQAATERSEGGAQTGSAGAGDLSLSVGGCSSITLEFAKAGMQVSLTCDDECLTISTDSGAEFKVPFRRAA